MSSVALFLDFTRCQRVDGTHYGTAGKCQKGREVDALEKVKGAFKQGRAWADMRAELKRKEELGSGAYGKVYDWGDGVVVKTGKISDNEIKTLDGLKHIDGIPRAISHVYKNPGAKSSMKAGILAMTKAPGEPLVHTYGMAMMKASTLDNIKDKGLDSAIDSTLKVLKQVHAKGFAHNDLHMNNVFWDSGNKKATIIDFGLATHGKPTDQLKEVMQIAYGMGGYAQTKGPLISKLRSNVQNLRKAGVEIRMNGKVNKPVDGLVEKVWEGI